MPRDKAHTIGGLPIRARGTRRQEQWEKRQKVWELKVSGIRISEISRQMGMSRQNVVYLLRHPPGERPTAETVRGARLRVRTEKANARLAETHAQALEPAYVPDPETPTGSIEFLKAVQEDRTVPITERIKCAIAVARLETAKEASSWTPPTDARLWGEAMLDALRTCTPEAREAVARGLNRPVSEETK